MNDYRSGLLARLAPLALAAMFFILAIAFYRKIALTNLILVDYDLLTYFYPYKEAAAAALREGRIPLWNPYLFTGAPFLANPQTALFYPLNLPGYFLPAPLAVKYSIVFHVFLAGVFMYAFARFSIGLGWVGGLASALSFMFGGFLTQQVGHINQLNAAIWLPLVFLLFDLSWRRRQPLFALLGGVALAAQILAGHSQETFLLLVALGFYFLYRIGGAMAQHPHPNSLPEGEGTAHQDGERIHSPAKDGSPSTGGKETDKQFDGGKNPVALKEGIDPRFFWERVGVMAIPWWRAMVKATPQISRKVFESASWPALALAIILGLGVGLSLVQLLPTLELSRESIRGGGLAYNEAISFSLPPWLLARSLLPSFKDSPFSEYIAYTGVLPFLLAVYGLVGRESRRLAFFWAGLAVLALFLALGGYNPAYELLYKVAPPLRLFRVPARWLYIYAFAMPVLAGIGAHRLSMSAAAISLGRPLRSVFLWIASALALVFAADWIAGRLKEGASLEVAWSWTGLVVIGVIALHFIPKLPGVGTRALAILAIIGAELFVAGSFVGTSMATAPQAYESLRPAVAQVLRDPGIFRILSISRTDFDPGDLPEIKSIFSRYLGQEELYQLLVALKLQETLSPNTPMKYGIATLDGYDGGVLPLRRYVEFKELLLNGAPLREAASLRPNQADALLRDQLSGIPDTRALGLLNVKYIITDKVGDLWVDNIYYDLSAPVNISPNSSYSTSLLPAFETTSLGLIFRLEGAQMPAGPVLQVTVRDRLGRITQQAVDSQATRELPQPGSYLVRLELEKAGYPVELSIRYLGRGGPGVRPAQGQLALRGLSLIDGRTGASESLVPDPSLLRVHSGDLKVYQNLDWVPRAFIAGGVWANDDQESLAFLRQSLVKNSPLPVLIPPLVLCTDNAAMIAACGYYRFQAGKLDGLDL
ncbi:MAG: hypothetical protein Q8O86_05660, partial [Dehalococcoidia bacterium]|nr:hypothetical protein [Dehalococcoidia bacterium]